MTWETPILIEMRVGMEVTSYESAEIGAPDGDTIDGFKGSTAFLQLDHGLVKVIVLGSTAGGGFPTWNCRCPVGRPP